MKRMDPQPPRQPSGFTLMEILIAMLILAIGIMATLSMQFTALGGASEARDNTNASEVAKRVLHIMRIEAQAWRTNTISGDLASQKTYEDGAFANTPILQATAENAGWTWTQVFSTPVDARLSPSGNTRYCAYTRGGYLDSTPSTGVFKVQIAVIYPGVNETFPGGTCFAGTDPEVATSLNPALAPDDTNSLQMSGFRANYFGGLITRRSYLP